MSLPASEIVFFFGLPLHSNMYIIFPRIFASEISDTGIRLSVGFVLITVTSFLKLYLITVIILFNILKNILLCAFLNAVHDGKKKNCR